MSRGCLKFGLVPVSSTAATEASAIAAEAFAAIPIAFLTVDSSVSTVVPFGGFERKFLDVSVAFSALEPQRGNVVQLARGSVLIIHCSPNLLFVTYLIKANDRFIES